MAEQPDPRATAGTSITISARGGPDVLKKIDQSFTGPMPGFVRVVAHSAGVAYGDLLLREGLVPRTKFPVVPGYDVAGVVDAVGDDVTGIAVGDRVVAKTGGTGGYATHVTVRADLTVPFAGGTDPVLLSALALNYVTALQMLSRTVSIGDGSTILVHGAAGGVGSALSELALLRGIRVLGTASANRLNVLESSGVHAVDRSGNWQNTVRTLAPGGVDVVFDAVGGATSARSLPLLGVGGHLVAYGVSSVLSHGRRSLFSLGRVALQSPRRSSLGLFATGLSIDSYDSSTFVPAHASWFRSDLASLIQLLADGAIHPAIAARIPLSRAADAHRLLAQGVAGKIVLVPDVIE
jgi:NADPH:quinone reductase-like Zn-dependent oxidoreductase